jgi:predicted lipoprotein
MRLVLTCLIALAAVTGARADEGAVVRAIYRDWLVPRSAELVAESAKLTRALQGYCVAPDADAALLEARRAWRTGLLAWERVSTVAVGPVVDRRLRSRLDFMPTRPRLITRAVAAAPASADDMDLIGTPAKGFPALEWLLWTNPMQPVSAECRYAVQVAMEIEREAQVLEKLFRQDAAAALNGQSAQLALRELVNQWLGGLERLRWAQMEKPVQEAATSEKKTAPEFPREASDATAASWAAQWETLHALADGLGGASLAGLLRERGQPKVAEALSQSVVQADTGMAQVDPADPAQVMASARRLSALRRVLESDVAPALDVRIGFSDADGD